MKSDRLLSMLMLLQVHRQLPASDLAERLEVSVRTVYRDVEALMAAGIPVYTEQGRHGGIALLPGYRTDLTGLTAGEARALFVFSGRGPLEELGRGDDLRQAVRKLLATVPEAHRAGAAAISERVIVDPHSWRRSEETVPYLRALEDAVLSDRYVTMDYPSRSARRVRGYRLAPYGLVAKAGVWYVIGETPAVGVADRSTGPPDLLVRTFRVGRIVALAVTDEHFERPPGLDVEQLWAESRQALVRPPRGYRAEIRIDPGWRSTFERRDGGLLRGPLGEPVPEDPGGWVRAELECAGLEHARAVLLAYGPGVEVLAPADLRAAMGEAARAMAARYS